MVPQEENIPAWQDAILFPLHMCAYMVQWFLK